MSQPERPRCGTCVYAFFYPDTHPWKTESSCTVQCRHTPPKPDFGFPHASSHDWCGAHQDYPAYVAAMKANQADA